MKYEILIAANNKDGNRKKQGDIITVRPHPWNWGRREIDNYLIVITDIDEIANIKDKLIIPGDSSEKRRYKIDLADLKTNYCPELDTTKVENETMIYQPFKKASQLVDKLALDIKDVDCGLSEEEEIVTAKNPLNLIYDKTAETTIDVRGL